MVIDDQEIIARYQNQFEKLWFEKYNPQRTRQLYQIAKIDFLPTSSTPVKPEDKIININSASQDELIKILKISEPLAQKIITLREELGEFKESKNILQLPVLTNLDWKEWKEEGIKISIE